MEDGIENDGKGEIDQLHDQLSAETTSTTEENATVAEVDSAAGDATTGVSPNKDLCEEFLATALRWHTDGVRKEFERSLEGVGEPAQAKRIAERATMSPEMQSAIATHGARAAAKYGIARFLNDESVLVLAVLAYWKNLSAARAERDEIVKKHGGAASQTQEEKKS